MAEEQKDYRSRIYHDPASNVKAGSYRSTGAYANPAVSYVDYTVIQKAGDAAARNISSAVMAKQDARLKFENEIKENYSKYLESAAINTSLSLGDMVQDELNENLKSFDNFLDLDQRQQAETLRGVEEFNSKNKIIDKTMKEIGSYEIDIMDLDKPSMKIVNSWMKGDMDAVKSIAYTDGRIGADYEYTNPETGEKTIVTQRDILAELSTLKNITPELEAFDSATTANAKLQQNIVNSDANRYSKRDIIAEQAPKFLNAMEHDTKVLIYQNRVNKGIDYHPESLDGFDFESEDEMKSYWAEQDKELLGYITNQFDEKVMQPKPAIYVPKSTGSTGSGGSNSGSEYGVRPAATVVLDQNLMKGGKFNPDKAKAAKESIESKLLDIISGGKKFTQSQADIDKAALAAEDYIKSLKNGTDANTARILQGSNTIINNRYIPIQDPFFIVNDAGEIELHYSLEQKGSQSTGGVRGEYDDI